MHSKSYHSQAMSLKSDRMIFVFLKGHFGSWFEDGLERSRVVTCSGRMDNATALLHSLHVGNAFL